MHWLVFAMLQPFLHGFANVIDNHLIHNLFRRTTTLILFASFTDLLFLPVIFFLSPPSMITANMIPFFILIGAAELGYLFPYFKALRSDDTSVVVSLFSLGKIFVPVLAFLFVGEVLSAPQYAGFIIIIASSALVTLKKKQRLHLNASFFWMMLCTFILAVEIVIYKHVFTLVDWGTGFVWATVFAFIIAMIPALSSKVRADVKAQAGEYRKSFGLFALAEFLNFGGTAALTYAVSLTAVTLVSAIGSFQPIFVLLYALVLGRFFPKAFKEDVSAGSMAKKTVLFLAMVVGVMLILPPG